MKIKTKHFSGDCTIQHDYYQDNFRPSIRIIDLNGHPIMTASVNIPDEPCEPDHTYIKDWSENEGILQALLDAGIIKDTGKSVEIGFVSAKYVQIL